MKSHNLTSKKLISSLSLLIGSTVGTIALLGQTAFAQQVNSMDNRDRPEYQTNEQNTMGGGFGGNSFNAFDLIHRANMNRGRSMGEFQQETNSGMRSAAEEFKRQQNERLQMENQQSGSSAPVGEQN
ncbi:MAG: hypothetical protein HC847_10410 [Hydrococcus sp. RU_2_2]|nr:hypothetical protein [Hydrococcus sp. RU_2_2]NJP18493.1 hypothetical protein [Hydrococcus sp. CRU_1_1]